MNSSTIRAERGQCHSAPALDMQARLSAIAHVSQLCFDYPNRNVSEKKTRHLRKLRSHDSARSDLQSAQYDNDACTCWDALLRVLAREYTPHPFIHGVTVQPINPMH